MKSSLHYVLALSLIAAPLTATDCTENTCITEVTQPEQQDVQPFYKKVGQKLWEHRNKIAITLFTVGLVAASTYVLWKAGASQQAVTTPEALVTQVNTANPEQPSSTASAVKPTETISTSVNETSVSTTSATLKTEQTTETAPVVNDAKTEKTSLTETLSKIWSKIPSFSWHRASKKGPHHLDGVDAVMP